MSEQELRWGISLANNGAFAFGACIFIGDGTYYLFVYFGKRILVIGKHWMDKHGNI